jgi:uncharacterized DUF497 family protein
MQFEWDAEKAAANARKHRVSFEEGETVFRDPLSLTFPDPDHWHGEHRYIEMGYSTRGRPLIVSYTERQGRIRIISCRVAMRKERRRYEEAEDDLTGPG